MNQQRSAMTGVNHTRLPSGTVVSKSDGTRQLKADNGATYNLRSNGTISLYAHNQTSATFRPDGKMQFLNSPNLRMSQGPHGERTVESIRTDGTRVVSYGQGNGFVEKAFSHNGTNFVQRNYVSNHAVTSVVYARYPYHGRFFQFYLPPFYYPPAFYGWVLAPWSAPISWHWGWAAAPWVAYYSNYFVPYPVYPAPQYWLTDYLFAETLETDYVRNAPPPVSAHTSASSPNPTGSAGKQKIAEEVACQVARIKAESGEGGLGQPPRPAPVPAAFDSECNGFFVSAPARVLTEKGTSCDLTAGDVLELPRPAEAGKRLAKTIVVSSKQGDCASQSHVSVRVEELQEMRNREREILGRAYKSLAENQAHDGIPPGPVATLTINAQAQPQLEYGLSDPECVNEIEEAGNKQERETEQDITNGT
jgi:hypothetical protein